MKRVNVYRNGTATNGKVIMITHSMEDLLLEASKKLDIHAVKVFTAQGGEIDDISVIRDEDTLFISEGEQFIVSSTSKGTSCDFVIHPIKANSMKQGWVVLNVGGKHFATTRSTLTTKEPTSMLARMFADDEGLETWANCVDDTGAFLIDRSPIYFEPILNYLRHGKLVIDNNVNLHGVMEEAKFFGIESLVVILEKLIQEEDLFDNKPLSRKQVVKTLISTSFLSELRFQGVNLARADLSRLDLRHINFKYANLQCSKLSGANLSYCCLERTDLSNANLEGAILLGVKMLCANLEGANLKSCNMEDPSGNKANMEGVNLKGANLEGSQMAGVNLRVATLKNANLQNCDLRGAVLAGADLENCDLSGSDLHEANLRGCNLKNTAFELIVTPLHMAQTIR